MHWNLELLLRTSVRANTEDLKLRKSFLKNYQAFFAKINLNAYLFAIIIVAICTLFDSALFFYVDASNLIMLYLLGVVIVATYDSGERGPAVLAALFSTLAFDFFFIPPFYSFAVSDIQYFFTLLVMLIITQTISHLTIHVQRQIDATRKAKMLAESERLRNILLTSISHDLRTPLTAIMGSATTLLHTEKLTEAMRRELAQNIYVESKRLNNMVTNVLQIIRLESRTVKIAKQHHVIEDIINETLERFPEQLANKRFAVHIARHMPQVPLDPILIEQALTNLIENAIKYSPTDSQIEISARLSGKNALLKIADQGPGIPEVDKENIFDKFYRGNQSETNHEGFGLGLTICKNIMAAHGGKIWAENRKEGGAIFFFTLPLED